MNCDYIFEAKYYKYSGWLTKLFFSLVFFTWLFFFVNLILFLFDSDTHFIMVSVLFVFTIGWGAAGFILVDYWFWLISGKELIIASENKLILEKSVFRFKRRKVFDLSHVKNINHSNIFGLKAVVNGLPNLGFDNGRIRFDYGMKTYRFANCDNHQIALEIIKGFRSNKNFSESNFE